MLLTPLALNTSLKWSSVSSNSLLFLSKSLTKRQTSCSSLHIEWGSLLEKEKKGQVKFLVMFSSVYYYNNKEQINSILSKKSAHIVIIATVA